MSENLPINKLISLSVRCTKCGAAYGKCDCWVKCAKCGHSYYRSKVCQNCKNKKILVDSIREYPALSANKRIMQGLPCIKGTRITTGVILQTAYCHIKKGFPNLNKEQILQALGYSAHAETEIIKD